MDFLNDLQKQAEAARQKGSQPASDVAAGPELYKAINAKLNEAYDFWKKAFESLNIIKPDVHRVYFLDSDVKLELAQTNYSIKGDKATNLENVPQPFSLEIRLLGGNQPIEVIAKSDSLIQRLKETLMVYNIGNEFKQYTNKQGVVEGGLFKITQALIARITFTPKPNDRRIDIAIRHLDRLGDYFYEYYVEEISAKLLEELAKLVLNKDNEFRTLGQRQLEKSSRFILKKNIPTTDKTDDDEPSPPPTQSKI